MGIFAFALIVLFFSKLPEPILEEAKQGEIKHEEKATIGGALKYRHFALGIVAIFLYVGMSVPPVMMANVASNIYEQWLSKL